MAPRAAHFVVAHAIRQALIMFRFSNVFNTRQNKISIFIVHGIFLTSSIPFSWDAFHVTTRTWVGALIRTSIFTAAIWRYTRCSDKKKTPECMQCALADNRKWRSRMCLWAYISPSPTINNSLTFPRHVAAFSLDETCRIFPEWPPPSPSRTYHDAKTVIVSSVYTKAHQKWKLPQILISGAGTQVCFVFKAVWRIIVVYYVIGAVDERYTSTSVTQHLQNNSQLQLLDISSRYLMLHQYLRLHGRNLHAVRTHYIRQSANFDKIEVHIFSCLHTNGDTSRTRCSL